jgi:hypothetical protein
VSAMVNRHSGGNEIITYLSDFYTEVAGYV